MPADASQGRLKRAIQAQKEGALAEAETLYRDLLREHPGHPQALHNLATIELQRGHHEAAIALMNEVATGLPGWFSPHLHTAMALQALGRLDEAVESYDRCLALKPDCREALMGRGECLWSQGLPGRALADHQAVARLGGADPAFLFRLGSRLMQYRRPADALVVFDTLLAQQPGLPAALNNRGRALRQLGRFEQALVSFEQAIECKADYAEAYNNLGTTLRDLGRHEEALSRYARALQIRPTLATCAYNIATTLLDLHRFEEATEAFARVLTLDPDFAYAKGYLFETRLYCCDWRDYRTLSRQIVADVRAGKPAVIPFSFLSVSDSPADQQICAQAFVRDRFPAQERPIWSGVRYRHERIRLAYLSSDFYGHATAYLIAELIERHDRDRFEVFGIAFGPDRTDEMSHRLKKGFDHFIAVGDRGDREIAALLRDHEIDIAVDLKGFTANARPGIFAHRGAPLQVNYLGYPGTMGAPYIDYIIADRTVIPEDHQVYYTERVVYLPDSYQVNDSGRVIAPDVPPRAAHGLPAGGFVFCCFNGLYKITPELFDIWMHLLRDLEHSVLWLLEGTATARKNLQREARARGIDPARLVFAPRMPLDAHLARHRHADLFLDTLPINAHTTASDALWAGLPVLTCRGDAFAGRVAASLLAAVGLPELVVGSLSDYAALARGLASDPARLAEIRAALAAHRADGALFDSGRFRRHLETAYRRMWERHRDGDPPGHLSIPND